MEDIEIGTPPILCIGYEVSAAEGYQDLLYVDETGLMTVVETKLKRNPESRREVVAQILEYAAAACQWSKEDVEAKAATFFGSKNCPRELRGLTLDGAVQGFLRKSGREADDFDYSTFIDTLVTNLEDGRIRLIIVVDEFRPPLLRTVEFVNKYSGHYEMYLFQLKRFFDKASRTDIFIPSIFGRVPGQKRKQRKTWSWEAYGSTSQWDHVDLALARTLTEKLELVTRKLDPDYEIRFHETWIGLHCRRKEAFGVGVSKNRGLHLWFVSPASNPVPAPRGVTIGQTGSNLYLSGKVDKLTDRALQRLCKETVERL